MRLMLSLMLALAASPVLAQPPADLDPVIAPGDGDAPPVPFGDVSLSNAVKGAKRGPDIPLANRNTQIRANGRASRTVDDYRAMARKLAPDVENDENVIANLFNADMLNNLAQLGSDTSRNHIPPGYAVQVTGEIWLPNGGYSPQVTSMAFNGQSNSAIDFDPGGPGFYGSATAYDVAGDTVHIRKSMQIGDQSVVIPDLAIRSGETAVVRLPGGAVFRVTPVIVKAP